MNKIFFLFFLSLFLSFQAVFSENQNILVFPIRLMDTNMVPWPYYTQSNLNRWLIESLSNQGRYSFIDDGQLDVLKTTHPELTASNDPMDIETGKYFHTDAVLKSTAYYFDSRLIIHFNVFDVKLKKKQFEDEIYTYQLSNENAVHEGFLSLGSRMMSNLNGTPPEVYIEKNAADKDLSDLEIKELTEGSNLNAPQKISRLQLFSLANASYFYPNGVDLGLLTFANVWIQPDWLFGFGIGTQLARLFVNLPGQTNVTGTILPLQGYMSLYVNPRAELKTDLLFSVEWAWYRPIDINTTTTNTNVTSLIDNPLNYVDAKFSFFFTPFTSISTGIIYYYSGSFNFYVGATVYLGYYKKE